jgi:hypothetical protein
MVLLPPATQNKRKAFPSVNMTWPLAPIVPLFQQQRAGGSTRGRN